MKGCTVKVRRAQEQSLAKKRKGRSQGKKEAQMRCSVMKSFLKGVLKPKARHSMQRKSPPRKEEECCQLSGDAIKGSSEDAVNETSKKKERKGDPKKGKHAEPHADRTDKSLPNCLTDLNEPAGGCKTIPVKAAKKQGTQKSGKGSTADEQAVDLHHAAAHNSKDNGVEGSGAEYAAVPDTASSV
jgi:hypothetical protein